MSSPSARPAGLQGSDSERSPHDAPRWLSRRAVIGGATAAAASVSLGGGLAQPATAATGLPQNGHRLVSKPPALPHGFASRYIVANGLRQHVVIGGDGPPLLLLHGWPQFWYQFRLIMPALARHFRVIAPDQRGRGMTSKPSPGGHGAGYDTSTLADDVAALMDALDHPRFSVIGCDTGMDIAYALAADHRDRVDRLAVAEAVLPGVSPSPPLFLPTPLEEHLFHLLFNRLPTMNVELVHGREDTFFGFVFAVEAFKKLPRDAVKTYIDNLADSLASLRGSFGFYRAWDTTTAQNQRRATRKLTLPVLAIGGAKSGGTGPGEAMKLAAHNVQTVVLPDCGHFVAEEAPRDMLAALLPFLTR